MKYLLRNFHFRHETNAIQQLIFAKKGPRQFDILADTNTKF